MGAAPAPNPALKTRASSEPSIAAKVENWTKKEWNAAKKKWSQDKAKWNACNQDTKDRRLSGRKNWSYLYDSMTQRLTRPCRDLGIAGRGGWPNTPSTGHVDSQVELTLS